MARDFRSLCVACGVTPAPGVNAVAHIPGWDSLTDMASYLIPSVAYSGEPVPEVAVSDNTLFNITATIERGGKAYLIQQNTAGRWSFSFPVGGTGVAATLESFSASGSPAGATHNLGLRLRSPYGGGASVSASLTQPTALQPADPFTDPWPVRLSASLSGTGGGSSLVTLVPAYVPDLGGFNPTLNALQWSFTMNHRAWSSSDFEVQWHANSGYSSLVSSLFSEDLTASSVYPTNTMGLLPGETLTLYLRYRLIGASSWTNHGAVTRVDSRDPS